MKSKRPAVGKHGKQSRNAAGNEDYLQNHINEEKLESAYVELQKWRTNRMNYLKSRVSHIHLKSPSPVNIGESIDERNKDGSPTTSETVIASQSPLQMAQVMRAKTLLSNRKQLVQRNASKSLSKSNSCMSSSGNKNVMLNGTDTVVPEIIRKTRRKVPSRHLDFISDSVNERNTDSKHITITSCLKQSHKSLDKQAYRCSSCPSFFTSRRGMANHCKLHGANKRFKCASCDFGCDNYKTLQMHKAFHTAASKETSENIASTHLALVIDNCADDENVKRGTKGVDEKTGSVIASNRGFACIECPFISRDQNRLQKHLVGHRRTNGFKCSLCTYMSASAGFLKRHCELHKPQIYQWPPVYIGKRPSLATPAAKNTADPTASEGCEEQQKIPKSLIASPLTTPFVSEKQPMITDDSEEQSLIHRSRQKYLCGFCRRHFKSYTLRLLHCIIRHSQHIAKEKYKSLLRERLNMCYGAVDTTEGTADNYSVPARSVHHCSHCPFTCKQKSRLLRHENKHIVKAEHECKYCTFSCRSTVVLMQHLRLHQRIPRLLQMPGRPKDLHANEKASASAFKVEKCSECPYTSRHICDLRTHAQMHIGKREFACGQCTYSTKRSHVLDAHLQLHMAERKGITSVSNTVRKGENFRSHSILRRHGKIVGERSGHQFSSVYICRWCPYRTRICATLFIHHRNHLWNGRLRCEKCTFSTCYERKLRDHVKLHLPTEPFSSAPSNKPATVNNKSAKLPNGDYSCQECPFTCNGYGKFWHHKQKHQKPSRYQCDLCSYSVGSNFCLVKHRQSHKNQNNLENCDAEIEKFIIVKNCYSEEINANGMNVAEREVKEEQKGCIINSTDELCLNCPKDAKTYQFSLSRIALKLPNFKVANDAESLSKTFRCKQCPYFGTDEMLFKYHEGMHVGHRQYSCNLCTYSSLCPISLHRHLNLHFPSLSSRSAAKNRKRLLRHRYHQSPETIPSDVKVHQCTICSYKTAYEDRFEQHRLDHALHIQQRLTTSIKRTAQNTFEPFVRPKIRRPDKRSDRQFTCSRCSFRCDTIVAYNTHFEKHVVKSFFTCKLCDYSSETKNVIKLKDDIECKKYPRQELSCCRCDYRTFVMVEFTHHWEQMHCGRAQKGDRRIVEELRMDMVHSSWIKTVDN
uniref:C2H2-type domain-containing protein n=1 Tax=Wuchereria bancrofti TaxID=6293 RepID=A0A1I8EMK2_WUCBA